MVRIVFPKNLYRCWLCIYTLGLQDSIITGLAVVGLS